MKAGCLSMVVAIGTALGGCGGGAAVCPDPAATRGPAPQKSQSPADSAAPRLLEGTYRVVEHRLGNEVTRLSEALLAQNPACYAMRMLWTFHERSLGMDMEILCDTTGAERTVELCKASLEVDIQWRPDGFTIPASVRAAGALHRIALKFEPLPGGMRRSTSKAGGACNVAVKATTIAIKQKGDSLVLSSAEGEMHFVPEPGAANFDWNREALRLYEERHGAK
jgi:hypothetical protein